jgi:SAM-dependent methyltransferase
MDVPGFGVMEGQWDIRGHEREYTGSVDVRGKRVLDVGAASGFFTFYFERKGADVIAYDLSEDDEWDIVPFASTDLQSFRNERRLVMRRLNNSFRLAHAAFDSRARAAYGTIYELPGEIGEVDVAFFGSILLHTRDPFRALQSVAAITRETIVVTDVLDPSLQGAEMRFLPDPTSMEPKETWWTLSPELMGRFLRVLGFAEIQVTTHEQQSKFGARTFFTVVARRSGQGSPSLLGRAVHSLRHEGPAGFTRRALHFLAGLRAPQQNEKAAQSNPRYNGLPVPPPELIFLAIGRTDAEPYIHTGAEIASTIRSHMARNNVDISAAGPILDFGCGAGRILRHFKDLRQVGIFGSDYNPHLVEWAAENLPFASFSVNGYGGPLGFEDGKFGLAYAFSVFTHMREEDQILWMRELRRVLRPGGYLYFTTHGEAYLAQVPYELHSRFKDGKVVVVNTDEPGTNQCGAYHPQSYVREVLAEGFEVVDFFPSEYPQDAYLFRRVD